MSACETCKGLGTIVGEFGNPYADEEGTCPTCDGTGEVEGARNDGREPS